MHEDRVHHELSHVAGGGGSGVYFFDIGGPSNDGGGGGCRGGQGGAPDLSRATAGGGTSFISGGFSSPVFGQAARGPGSATIVLQG